jgi:transposase-like protein/IS1 family transposase
MTCTKCTHGSASRFGTYGKRKTQRWRCTSCHTTFADPNTPKPFGSHYTDTAKAAQALSMMLEGMSIRAISRLTGLHKNTILSLLETAGENCSKVMDAMMRDLPCRRVQCDEIWTFVQKKGRHVRQGDSPEFGDQWVFIALDADTKLIPTFLLGKRSSENTQVFIKDLYRHVSTRIQLTTDAFIFYGKAVEQSFGMDVDYGQLTKLYGDYGQHGNERYSPSPIMEVISKVRQGNPDPDHISTSYVERSNLTLRMQIRRFTRLTNAHSRKLDNLKHAVSLYMAWYNFCRIHSTLRVTPAMESGLADHAWTIMELLTRGSV